MATLAKALKIVCVKEQGFIAAMRFDVIDHGSGDGATDERAKHAKGLGPKLFGAKSFPFCAVVQAHLFSQFNLLRYCQIELNVYRWR